MNPYGQHSRVALVVNALSGNELKAGKNDSARIYGVLVDPALGACDPARASLVQDCPDRFEFNEKLLEALTDWSPEDQLLFYFSGHGEERQGLLHLCFGAEKRTYFPFKHILTELTSNGVNRAIIILDSCQSGAALRKGEKSAAQGPVASDDEIPKGLAIVTSCRANEHSHEKDDQTQSVFTGLFCDAITTGLSGAKTSDGKISISDLVGWVNKTLRTDPKLSGFSQTSTYGINGAESPVWVALNKSGCIIENSRQGESVPANHPTGLQGVEHFDNWLTNVTAFSPEAVRSFRGMLRPDVRELLSDELDEAAFLSKANLALADRLYASGVLLFSEHPEKLLPCAYVQCFEFKGLDRSAPQSQKEFYGPLIRQLEGVMTFIESRIESVEITEQGALAAKFEFQYPMVCIRELLANALCHRDYADKVHHIHVRLFHNRVEIVSPGLWAFGAKEENTETDLASLESESAARNERLATALRRIRLVETGGSGIPSAVSDCTERGARPPTVLIQDGTVRVTIYPRTEWSKIRFARRRAQRVSKNARFRVAFSFSSKKREFVGKVANILARRFGESAILYDRFHEAEFARTDLGSYLPNLYEEAELIVAVVDFNFGEGSWTGLEWPTIGELAKQGREQDIMLCRFDRAAMPELPPSTGFIELDDKTPEQTATLVLERLALNEDKPRDYYTKREGIEGKPRGGASPHNLPSLQPFFGRQEELRKVSELLVPENRSWGVLIGGPGGIGKTSLAIRAAYGAPSGVFERIVFISLKTRELDDAGVRDLSGFVLSGLTELFGELARELGYNEIAKGPEDQRPRLLLGAMRGTRVLLVLDNLECLVKSDQDVLLTFVRRLPSGCKAILTSRTRMGSGLEEIILNRLSPEAALATLAELATRNPVLAATSEAERLALYRETGGHPLLLRWTAGQIGRGSLLTVAHALDFLRSSAESYTPLEFILGDLMANLTADETRVLSALTYFILPAKVTHLAEIAQLSEAETDRALGSLVNRSLAVASGELQSFASMPVVADFLRREKPEIVAAAGNRLEKRAYAVVVENGYEKHERFSVLDSIWSVVAASLPRFLAGANDRLQTVCDALDTYLDFTGRWDEWLALNQQAEAKAVEEADFQTAGWRAYRVGYIHQLRGHADAVLGCAERATSYWNAVQAGAREHAFALQLRAHGERLNKDYRAAIFAYREAVALFGSLSPVSADLALALNDLATAESDSGDLAAAERDYRDALSVARALDYSEGAAIFTGNLAELTLEREDWEGAESIAREALILAEKLGRMQLIASNSQRIASALVRQRKRAEALPYARRAVEIYSRLGSPDIKDARAILQDCEEL